MHDMTYNRVLFSQTLYTNFLCSRETTDRLAHRLNGFSDLVSRQIADADLIQKCLVPALARAGRRQLTAAVDTSFFNPTAALSPAWACSDRSGESNRLGGESNRHHDVYHSDSITTTI